jgi:hypothetical protein
LTNTPVKSMKAGDKFTVTPIPVPGYTFSTNHCSLDTGAQLGTNYFCYVHYVRTAY